jgi:hypothetical protein
MLALLSAALLGSAALDRAADELRKGRLESNVSGQQQ